MGNMANMAIFLDLIIPAESSSILNDIYINATTKDA
jgi:hypothetical protein